MVYHFIHVERELGQSSMIVERQPKLSLVIEPFASKRYETSGIGVVGSFIDEPALLVGEIGAEEIDIVRRLPSL